MTGTFLSCASDPPPEKKKSDPIVGSWERYQEVFVFSNDSVVINDFSRCPKINSLVFMDKAYDQAFAINYYTFIDEMPSPDSCYAVSGGGTWTKVSDKNYSTHIEYFEGSDPYNIVAETIEYTASFPSSDSLLLHNRSKLEQYQTEMENLQDYYIIYTLDTGVPPAYTIP